MTKEERAEMLALMQEAMKPVLDNQIQMQADIKKLQTDVVKINTTIENKIDRSIKITMEGHTDLNRKLDKNLGLDNRVETLEDKVSALEYVIKKAE